MFFQYFKEILGSLWERPGGPFGNASGGPWGRLGSPWGRLGGLGDALEDLGDAVEGLGDALEDLLGKPSLEDPPRRSYNVAGREAS